MKLTNSKKIRNRLIIGSMLTVLGVAGIWQLQTTNLSAAPKEETNAEEKKEQDIQNDEGMPTTRAAQPMSLVSNEAGLSATPKIFTIQQNATFPQAGSSQTELNKLITGLVIPAPNNGIVWDYVNEFGEALSPSSAALGFQTMYIEITELSNLTSIIVPIPVTVTNSNTTLLLSNSVALQADLTSDKLILYPNETVGKTDGELKELIKTKSNVRAWDLSTGEALTTTVSATTTKNNSVGAYTATFSVDFEGVSGTATKNVYVFGANLKAPGYFTVTQGATLTMGTNASTLFGSYQTFSNATASNATYEWVTADGEPTTPVNTFDSSQSGFHRGYIKMTEKTNTQVSTIIPIPITVTAEGQTVALNAKAGLSYQTPILSASDTRGKTLVQIISVLTQKLNMKAWELTTGQELTAKVTVSDITQVIRGVSDVTVSVTLGEESLTYVIKTFVLPDGVFGSEGTNGWMNVPAGSAQGTITNPINGSKIGFPGRGIVGATTEDGFMIRDQNGRGYVFSAGNGRVADVPGVGTGPLYGSWARDNGIGRAVRPQLTAKSFLRKGNSLKQLLIDPANGIVYVYDLAIARNLNFSIELKMYNLQPGSRNFSMLESVDTDYYSDGVPIYALGNNSGFYMEPQAGTRFTIRLKDNQGNWLSDYTKYITGSYLGTGVSGGTNYFGANFSGVGTESLNLAQNTQITTVGTDTAYQLGAPWKDIKQDDALKTGYQVFAGNEIPYMKLKADPEEWNIYQDNSDSSFETDYTLSSIPTATDFGTVYATYPNGEETKQSFIANASKEATGHLSIPRSTLPDVLNDVTASIKTYPTNMIAINEAEGPMQGLPSDDYAVNINVYNLGATPIAQSIRKDTTWTKLPAALVKDPVFVPGNIPVYEFVDGTPDTSEVGVQMIKVRMTDSNEPTQTKIIEVPLNVTAAAPPTTGLTMAANDFTVKKSALTGLSESEINALILKESKAIGWDNANGLSDGVTLTITAKTLTAESDASGSYTATIRATKGSANATKTINIKVNVGLDATSVLQTVTLGTGADYWTPARLKASIDTVTVDSTTVTDYSVTLLTAPVTNRISTTVDPFVPMMVKVTDNQNPSNTVDVEVAVRVTWGNSIAIGGSNTIVTSPNAQSSVALSLHEDSAGKPRLVSGYGNLPKANEGTPLSSSTGNEAYYQVTRYDLSSQSTGVANATEVTSGPNAVGDVTFQGLGNNTPAQLVDTFGSNGQLAVNYGDVLRLYVKDGQRALYTNNAGPTQLLGGVPNDETVFVVVTKNGFVPLYFNQLDAKDISISSDLTSSQAGYDDSYSSINSYFSIPNGVSGTNYTRVASAGFKTYPKLNLAVGEEATGSVYVAEPTSASSNQYLKYAYDVTFIGSGPELQIVEPLAPLSFGTQKIKSYTQELKRTDSNWGFTVLDSRLVKNGWVIQAKMENPFQTGTEGNFKELKGAALQLKHSGNTLSLNDGFQTIYQKDTPSASNFISWSADEGFFLQVPSGAIDKDATYTSRVDMILTNAPTE